MFARLWNAISFAFATVFAARDYSSEFLNNARDPADLERRIEMLERRQMMRRFPEL